MKTLSEAEKEAESYFEQLAQDRDATLAAYRHILATIDAALSAADCEALLSLIPYIEEGDGYLPFQYIGKTRRILRILHMIELEHKFQKIPFSEGCRTAADLLEKYMLTLFSLRRLLFQLSEDSVEEAAGYLKTHPVSHFAVYIITQDELLIPSQALYEALIALYSAEWSKEDTRQFLSLLGQA